MHDNKMKCTSTIPKLLIEQWISQYWHEIPRYALSMMSNKPGAYDDAEDVAQDTFIRAYSALCSRPEEQILYPRQWLRRLMQYALADFLRKKNKYQQQHFVVISLEQVEAFHPEEWDSLLEKLADSISDQQPETIVEEREMKNAIYTAIGRLPPAIGKNILLYCFDGYKHTQIAQKLEIKTGTSKANVHYGREMLRLILEEWRLDGR